MRSLFIVEDASVAKPETMSELAVVVANVLCPVVVSVVMVVVESVEVPTAVNELPAVNVDVAKIVPPIKLLMVELAALTIEANIFVAVAFVTVKDAIVAAPRVVAPVTRSVPEAAMLPSISAVNFVFSAHEIPFQ
jgi:hypothetical protein